MLHFYVGHQIVNCVNAISLSLKAHRSHLNAISFTFSERGVYFASKFANVRPHFQRYKQVTLQMQSNH